MAYFSVFLQERIGSLDNLDTLVDGEPLYAVPKEIFRLVDNIWQYGRHQVKQQLIPLHAYFKFSISNGRSD